MVLSATRGIRIAHPLPRRAALALLATAALLAFAYSDQTKPPTTASANTHSAATGRDMVVSSGGGGGTLAAPTGPGYVAGIVSTPSATRPAGADTTAVGDPLNGATVDGYRVSTDSLNGKPNYSSTKVASVVTDAAGKFKVSELPPSPYQADIRTAGRHRA